MFIHYKNKINKQTTDSSTVEATDDADLAHRCDVWVGGLDELSDGHRDLVVTLEIRSESVDSGTETSNLRVDPELLPKAGKLAPQPFLNFL